MNIGNAASLCGLPAKTIRYYEDIELVVPDRRDNGYRDYGDADVDKLRFLRRARGLGFSIEECRQLLSLYENRDRASKDVKELASLHLTEIDHKITELQGLRDTLRKVIEECPGDTDPDCPILDELASKSVR